MSLTFDLQIVLCFKSFYLTWSRSPLADTLFLFVQEYSLTDVNRLVLHLHQVAYKYYFACQQFLMLVIKRLYIGIYPVVRTVVYYEMKQRDCLPESNKHDILVGQ